MAHNRSGPDVVMNTRYAGHSEIRSVTDHENNRSEDGFSAIDPARTHLNQILHGPFNQQEALDQIWKKGVRKPAQQSETPYVQMVISASPEFFRGDHLGRGEWDHAKLDEWVKRTMKWLRREYGDDLAHVSLHLDEDTPHLHILIVPTYERKTRRPSQRTKSGESDQEFADRVAAWESEGAITITAGRSSSPYWSRMWCRRDARTSYHAAVADLGLGYGRDFVGEDEPSPIHKKTGKFVREEATRLAELAVEIEGKTVALDDRSKAMDLAQDERSRALDLRESGIDLREALVTDAIDHLNGQSLVQDERSKSLDVREAEIDQKALSSASEYAALAVRTIIGVVTGSVLKNDDGRWTVPASDQSALRKIWAVIRPAVEAVNSWWFGVQAKVDALPDADRGELLLSFAGPEDSVDDRGGPSL